jgi:hypothetical protein
LLSLSLSLSRLAAGIAEVGDRSIEEEAEAGSWRAALAYAD